MTTSCATETSPLDTLVAALPRDQALGLRLLGLARAAAACHMTASTLGASAADDAQIDAPPAQLMRSQAAALFAAMQGGAR